MAQTLSTSTTNSVGARLFPDVDAEVDGVPIDRLELVVGEVELGEGVEIGLELAHTAGANEGGGHALVAQHPGQRHLGERLATPLSDLAERAHVREVLLGEPVLVEERALGGARVLRDAVEV